MRHKAPDQCGKPRGPDIFQQPFESRKRHLPPPFGLAIQTTVEKEVSPATETVFPGRFLPGDATPQGGIRLESRFPEIRPAPMLQAKARRCEALSSALKRVAPGSPHGTQANASAAARERRARKPQPR